MACSLVSGPSNVIERRCHVLSSPLTTLFLPPVGVGEGLGDGEDEEGGVGEGVGKAVPDGEGVGESGGVAEAVTVGEGLGDAVGETKGLWVGDGVGDGVAVAADAGSPTKIQAKRTGVSTCWPRETLPGREADT